MIDLTKKGLPNAIEVDGNLYFIKTDFREWLKFSRIISNNNSLNSELKYLFNGKLPDTNPLPQLIEFFSCPEYTPNTLNGEEEEGEKLLDWDKDGSYIYASFLAEYGIDLIDVKYLHWHKFLALFRSLPDTSKIKSIMSMRGYSDNKDSYEVSMEKAKQMWSLTYKDEQAEQQRLLDEFNSL